MWGDALELEIDLASGRCRCYPGELGLVEAILLDSRLHPVVHGHLGFTLPVGLLMYHVDLVYVLCCGCQALHDGRGNAVFVCDEAPCIVSSVCPASQICFVVVGKSDLGRLGLEIVYVLNAPRIQVVLGFCGKVFRRLKHGSCPQLPLQVIDSGQHLLL